MLSSRGSSPPRDGTQVSCAGRWILYYRITREAPISSSTPHWSFVVDLIFWGGFPGGARGKDPACRRRRYDRRRFDSWVGKIPWRRKWQPTPVCLPGKSHGQRSLVGYRPRGPKRVGHNLVMKPTTTNLPFLNIFSLSEQYVC